MDIARPVLEAMPVWSFWAIVLFGVSFGAANFLWADRILRLRGRTTFRKHEKYRLAGHPRDAKARRWLLAVAQAYRRPALRRFYKLLGLLMLVTSLVLAVILARYCYFRFWV
ncbi:hypothetical protein [Qipengyuania sphaerica]|uniref:hypothetical protein n=1 Tax=Qipengyuania sphaerica TaxID=2867243 RepID=UPI001C8716E5|nr:hypothetical protein [Qipengyuania sphaerica]MBX7539440.1 hypothetical protein [Qipengyuania sphaerica]